MKYNITYIVEARLSIWVDAKNEDEAREKAEQECRVLDFGTLDGENGSILQISEDTVDKVEDDGDV